MSLQSRVGDIVNQVEDQINNLVSQASTSFENTVGSISTNLNNIWSGGFAGMSDQGMETLKSALTTFCNDLQATINGFDEQGNLEVALKGEAQAAAVEFVSAVKQLLQAYVSRMKQQIAEADQAYQNWLAASGGLASDVRSDATEIRNNANSIKLD